MKYLPFFAFLVACGQTPASIQFDPAGDVAVHDTNHLAVKTVKVLDASGAAIDPAPAVTWTVTPDSVAKLEGSDVVPVANGKATIEAAIGEVKASYAVDIALPDKVAVAGAPTANLPAGQTAQLTATVMAGETAIEGQTITWSSDNVAIATVDDKGLVTAVADGTANIKAECGALNATQAITVGAAAAETKPSTN